MRFNIAPCETVLRIWKPTVLVLNGHNRIKQITGWEWHNSKLSTTSWEATEVTGILNELPECYETTKNQVPSVFALQFCFCKIHFHKNLTSKLRYCETFLPFEFPDHYDYFIRTNYSMKVCCSTQIWNSFREVNLKASYRVNVPIFVTHFIVHDFKSVIRKSSVDSCYIWQSNTYLIQWPICSVAQQNKVYYETWIGYIILEVNVDPVLKTN